MTYNEILGIYYQKGGTYIVPVEIVKDIVGDIEELEKENEELQSRIDNAIEYIKKIDGILLGSPFDGDKFVCANDLLSILRDIV